MLAQEARDKMEYEKEVAEKREQDLKAAYEQALMEVGHWKSQYDQQMSAKAQAETSLHEALQTGSNQKVFTACCCEHARIDCGAVCNSGW